eukprot:3018_1
METEEAQGLTSHDAIATHTVSDDNNTHQPVKREIIDDTKSQIDCKMIILLIIIMLLTAIIIIVVLCGAYAGAFDQYTDCSSQCSSLQDIPTISFPNGNQYDFNTTVCEGYRDIWEDPSIPLDQRNQIGRGIFQTAEKMQQASELIKIGKSYNLYRPYSHDMPFAFGRYLNTTLICGYYPQWSAGSCTQQVKTNSIGNIGTQFDSFGHFFAVDVANMPIIIDNSSIDIDPSNEYFVLFNNFRGNQVFNNHLGIDDDGVNYLGVHLLPSFFTRGILVDIAGYKNVNRLPNKYNITKNDFLGALEAQKLSVKNITQGDVVLIYTGWSELYDTDPELFYNWDETPGIAATVILEVLFDTNVTIIGSDTWAVDNVGRNEWGTHKIFMTCGGGFVHEMLKLDEWILDARNGSSPWIGAYMFQPLPLYGAVAAPGKPTVFV